MNNIKSEFKKALNKKFFIIVSVITIILLYGLSNYTKYNGMSSYAPNNAVHSWLYVIENANFFRYMTPLIVVLAFGDSFYNEYKSGYLRNISTRMNIKKYIKDKIIVNAVVSALIMIIPVIILLVASLILYKDSIFVPIDGNTYFNPTGALSNIYHSTPVIYMIFSTFMMGVFAAVYSTLTIAISFHGKSRALILAFPSLVYLILQNIVEFIGSRIAISTTYYPSNSLLFFLESLSPIDMMIHYGIILGLAFFIIKKSYNEGIVI